MKTAKNQKIVISVFQKIYIFFKEMINSEKFLKYSIHSVNFYDHGQYVNMSKWYWKYILTQKTSFSMHFQAFFWILLDLNVKYWPEMVKKPFYCYVLLMFMVMYSQLLTQSFSGYLNPVYLLIIMAFFGSLLTLFHHI